MQFIIHQIFLQSGFTFVGFLKKSIIREFKNTVKGTYIGNREILDTWNKRRLQ